MHPNGDPMDDDQTLYLLRALAALTAIIRNLAVAARRTSRR